MKKLIIILIFACLSVVFAISYKIYCTNIEISSLDNKFQSINLNDSINVVINTMGIPDFIDYGKDIWIHDRLTEEIRKNAKIEFTYLGKLYHRYSVFFDENEEVIGKYACE